MEKIVFNKIDTEKHYEFLFNAHKETFKITFGREIDEAFFLRELAWETEKGIGAFLNNEPIGICNLEIRKNEEREYGWVHFFYLAPKYRGSGLSSQLISFAKEFCRKHNVVNLNLRTGANNIVAQKFYERSGFKREPLFDRGSELGYKLDL